MNFEKQAFDVTKNPECKHIGLVFSIAKKYFRVFNNKLKGMEFDDLVIIGYMALKKAWEGFKEEEGKEFVSYASPVIKDWIKKSIRKQGDIHIPEYINFQSWRIEDGKGVSEGFEAKANDKTYECLKKALSARKLQRQGMFTVEPVPKKSNSNEARFIDRDDLNYAFRFIDARAHEILSMRYGLTGDCPMTLEEVASELEITRERVRQIESRAFAQMRTALVKAN